MTTTLQTFDAANRRRSGDPIAKLPAAVINWMALRAARKALNGLDDFMLRDIGISRCDIEPAIRGQVHRRRAS